MNMKHSYPDGLWLNQDHASVVTVDGTEYQRLAIRTHVITEKDTMSNVAEQYAKQLLSDGDILIVSEKAVACSQKRALRACDIKPRMLAKFLSRFVYKSPHGAGLTDPLVMEMAIRECGTLLILFASFISAIGKLFRKRGWFYRIAGYKAASIDGPDPDTLPPYDKYVVLSPLNPDKTAKEIAGKLGHPVCIVDANNLGVNILGVSHTIIDKALLVKILKDNPLGQSSEQTPMGIVRCIAKRLYTLTA